MSGNVRTRRRSRLSNFEKRMLVRGRLIAPDSEGLSDRQIARELGLSQPFVSAQRRFVRGVLDEVPPQIASPEAARPPSLPPPSESRWPEAFEEHTERAREPIFTPVGLGRVGWVRRRPSFEDTASGEWDPFDLR